MIVNIETFLKFHKHDYSYIHRNCNRRGQGFGYGDSYSCGDYSGSGSSCGDYSGSGDDDGGGYGVTAKNINGNGYGSSELK